MPQLVVLVGIVVAGFQMLARVLKGSNPPWMVSCAWGSSPGFPGVPLTMSGRVSVVCSRVQMSVDVSALAQEVGVAEVGVMAMDVLSQRVVPAVERGGGGEDQGSLGGGGTGVLLALSHRLSWAVV